MAFVPVEILIQEGLEDADAARRARAVAPSAAARSFRDLTQLMRELEGLAPGEAGRRLVIARRAGGFVKEFPTGDGIRPSGWRYFIPAIGCPADCAYCFLQTYHAGRAPVVFAGLDAMFDEIALAAAAEPRSYFYGGELCDNLMLEEYLGIIPRLAAMFERLPEATLELRTKSDEVGPLLDAAAACARAPANVIVSWTFTPEDVARQFEAGAAPTAARIEAARLVAAAGYRVGARFDPIILDDGWEERYEALIGQLRGALPADEIESVHLGCLRFTPALKAAAAGRVGRTGLYAAEFVEASDGKLRYPRPLRAAAYARIARMVGKWGAGIPVGLCMETPQLHEDLRKLTQDDARNR